MKMNKTIRCILLFLGTCVAALAVAVETSAQSVEGFLYGTVHTDDNRYTGPIRWGGEEVLWTEQFNAAKASDLYMSLVPRQNDSGSWLDFDWSFSSIWEDKVAHQFVCRFGDIAKITDLNGRTAKVHLKNNAVLVVEGSGYNDMTSPLQVIDEERGMVTVNREHIRSIEFKHTPRRLKSIFGMPIYGTVEGVRKESVKGLILWDNDEHVGADKLDGNSPEGKMAIRFDEIKSIEKKHDGSIVKLHSGKEIFLKGTNDVNNENRGIIVVTEEMGMVKFSWKAFRKVDFSPAPDSGPEYGDFKTPALLTGTVSTLDDNKYTGRIVYDIDEAIDIEFLEGSENDIDYQIPFRLIRKVVPKNYDYAEVELTSGKTLLLGGLRDVSSKNGGLLVFQKGQKEPDYINWKNIYEIVFDR